jgi:hypothetical protein
LHLPLRDNENRFGEPCGALDAVTSNERCEEERKLIARGLTFFDHCLDREAYTACEKNQGGVRMKRGYRYLASTRERVVINRSDIMKLCHKVLGNAGRVLDGYEPANPAVTKETLLLWDFLEELYPALGLGRFPGIGAGDINSEHAARRKIRDVLSGRISESPDIIIDVINENLIKPALNRPDRHEDVPNK